MTVVLRGRARARPPVDAATACHAAAVSKVYGTRETAVHALRDVTLTIPRGAFTAIMGPSGSGKSTLLHCLAALDTPTSGRVFLGGTELTALGRRQQAQVRRDRIGFVFQSFNLVPTLDALENITLPQLLAGRRPDLAWLHHVIARVGLEDRLHHRPSELSGGQQQRIALARALAGRPEVIFADEPTGNLDTTASQEMLTLLRDAVDQFDQTVVTVTHDPSIAGFADQILYFSDGRVIDRTNKSDADHASDRPRREQVINSGEGRHDRRLPARRRADGQQTMRGRRRRQAEKRAPGRPMVGSDDEVEVARQERWLQRIREQFEAEHAALEDTDPEATTTTSHPSDPLHDTTGAFLDDHLRHQAPADASADADTQGDSRRAHIGGRRETPDLHPEVRPRQLDDGTGRHDLHRDDAHHAHAQLHHPAADANGWLPPDRARLYTAPDTGAPQAPGADTGSDRWRDDTVTRSEITPWSRPANGTAPHHEPPHTGTSGWRVTGDPWAPPDEHLAEEYHSERSMTRRAPRWQHDSGDIGSTGRWRSEADDTAGHEPVGDGPGDTDRFDDPAGHDADDHLTTSASGVDRPAWRVDAGDDQPRLARWRPDARMGDDDASTNVSHRSGRHADDAPPTVNGHAPGPWTSDVPSTPDVSEVWTPTFDRSWHNNGNGHAVPDARDAEPSRGDAVGDIPSDSHRAGDTPWSQPVDDVAPAHAEPDPIQGEPAKSWTDDGGPSAIDGLHGDAPVGEPEPRADVPRDHPSHHASEHDPASGAHEHLADAQPSMPSSAKQHTAPPTDRPEVAPRAVPVTHEVPDATPTPASHRRPEAPVALTRPERTTAASTRHIDAPVPSPLASLRDTAPRDEWCDLMEALQSLQDQLDRLNGAGRRNRRPRRAGIGDTDRPER